MLEDEVRRDGGSGNFWGGAGSGYVVMAIARDGGGNEGLKMTLEADGTAREQDMLRKTACGCRGLQCEKQGQGSRLGKLQVLRIRVAGRRLQPPATTPLAPCFPFRPRRSRDWKVCVIHTVTLVQTRLNVVTKRSHGWWIKDSIEEQWARLAMEQAVASRVRHRSRPNGPLQPPASSLPCLLCRHQL